MTPTVEPSVLDHAIREYDAVGATVLRNVVSPDWIARLGAAVDQIMEKPRSGSDLNRPGEGRFFGDLFSWLSQPELEAFVREAGLAQIAAQVMRSREVRFFYDQILVKEPGTPKRTPWHQDLPYWPARGDQILSMWVPLDTASPENGVVTYVKGSHLWGSFFEMENWSDTESTPDGMDAEVATGTYRNGPDGRSIVDIHRNPERYEFVSWAVEPGDVILHHCLTVHGAPGNLSRDCRRRAIATRWFGDDAKWDETRPHFMKRLRDVPDFPYPALATGQKIDDPLFPRLWPA